MRRLALLPSLVLALAACLGSDFADSLDGSWQMTSGTVDGDEIPRLDAHPITIVFDGDRVTGTAPCNSYGGDLELSGSQIRFENLAMTEMACFPEEAMVAEAMYTDAITRVQSVSLDGDLALSGDGVELVFEALEPVPDAELTNTVWVLDGLIVGDAVSTPVLGTRSTIEFFSDGSVLGDSGCRPFSGRYTVSGSEVAVTEMSSDGHECEPELAAQDSHFLGVIGDGFRAEIENKRLTAWSRGDLGLVFVSGS